MNWHPVMIDETGSLRGGPADSSSDPDRHGDLAVEEAKPKLKPPSMYKVLMLNDDYTPMDFVVEILEDFFNLDREQATRVSSRFTLKEKRCAGFTRKTSPKQKPRKWWNTPGRISIR